MYLQFLHRSRVALRLLLMAAACCACSALGAQEYCGGAFRRQEYRIEGQTFTLYDLQDPGSRVKAKYFAQGAARQFAAWKSGKQLLLVSAGAFSDSWIPGALPPGLCVDNGLIVNRSHYPRLQGMLLLHNSGPQAGSLEVVDLDYDNVKVSDTGGSAGSLSYGPRSGARERQGFLSWAERSGATLCQAQLLYSTDRSSNFTGRVGRDKRGRRFLAVCRKEGVVHHVLVDAPAPLGLNFAASRAKGVLEFAGFTVRYLVNLETGGRDRMQVFDGSGLAPAGAAGKPDAPVESSGNLLVYYIE